MQEHNWQFLLVSLPQIKGSPIFYRSNQLRKTNPGTINLASKNLQNVPLFEGEDAASALYLNNNQIYNIENLVSLPNLTLIDFSNNLVHEVGGFENLNKIETLLLGQNFIKSIRSFDKISLSLRKLDLSNNQLKSMQWLSALPNLQILDLSTNLLTSVDVEGSHSVLENLNLSKNPLISVQKLLFFDNLKTLNLEQVERVFELEQTVQQLVHVDIIPTTFKKSQQDVWPSSSIIFAEHSKIDGQNPLSLEIDGNSQALRIDSTKLPDTKELAQKNLKKAQEKGLREKPGVNVSMKEISEVFAELTDEINRKEFGKAQKAKVMRILTPANMGSVEHLSVHHVKVTGNGCFQFFQNALAKYLLVEEITFDCVLISNIILKENMAKLMKMKRLVSLNLTNNNITSYLELIHLENLPQLQKLQIASNPITRCELLRYFIFYRFSKIKSFNNTMKKEKDLSFTKSLYIKFDKALQKPLKAQNKKVAESSINRNQLAKKVSKIFLDNLVDDLQTDRNIDGCLEKVALEFMLRPATLAHSAG